MYVPAYELGPKVNTCLMLTLMQDDKIDTSPETNILVSTPPRITAYGAAKFYDQIQMEYRTIYMCYHVPQTGQNTTCKS